MRSGAQAWINEQFDAFVFTDAKDRNETYIRCTAIGLSMLALFAAMSDAFFLIAGVVYVLVTVIYVRFLERAKAPVARGHLWAAGGMSLFISILFGATAIYVAMLEDGMLIAIAFAASIGLLMHSIARTNSFSIAAFIDLATTVITTSGVFIVAATQGATLGIQITIVIVGVGVITYLGLSWHVVVSDRIKLREKSDAEIRSERMRVLSQLSRGVAHDFNNVLAAISGNIELSQIDEDPSRRDGYLREALAATVRGRGLSEKMLAYTQESRLRKARHELGALLTDMGPRLSAMLPANVRLTVIPLHRPIWLLVDSHLLEIALMNLVSNARDAIGAEKGEVNIEVLPPTGVPAADGVAVARLRVTDTGPGMAGDVVDYATEPFFSTKRLSQNTGMGLPMVKGFAEQSGGALRLANLPDGGFEAQLTLPLDPEGTLLENGGPGI